MTTNFMGISGPLLTQHDKAQYNGWQAGVLASANKHCLDGHTGNFDDSTCFESGSLCTDAQMDACGIASQDSENVGILSYPQKKAKGRHPLAIAGE